MKAKLLYFITFLSVGISCTNEPELSTSIPDVLILPTEDWYVKIALEHVSKNEVLPSSVKKAIQSSYKDFGGSYAYETYHYVNGMVSHLVESKSIPGEYLIVNQTANNKFHFVTLKISDQLVMYFDKEKKLLDFDLRTGKASKVNGYPGDCSELGPRRAQESFTDCLMRNLDNFCCDFTGCAAIIAMPTAVAVGATFACSPAFSE